MQHPADLWGRPCRCRALKPLVMRGRQNAILLQNCPFFNSKELSRNRDALDGEMTCRKLSWQSHFSQEAGVRKQVVLFQILGKTQKWTRNEHNIALDLLQTFCFCVLELQMLINSGAPDLFPLLFNHARFAVFCSVTTVSTVQQVPSFVNPSNVCFNLASPSHVRPRPFCFACCHA